MPAGPFEQNDYDSLSIHYQFHASQGNPKTDPVATWHQGGPGGSSIDVGLCTHPLLRAKPSPPPAPPPFYLLAASCACCKDSLQSERTTPRQLDAQPNFLTCTLRRHRNGLLPG
jgi:hypothetical protein